MSLIRLIYAAPQVALIIATLESRIARIEDTECNDAFGAQELHDEANALRAIARGMREAMDEQLIGEG